MKTVFSTNEATIEAFYSGNTRATNGRGNIYAEGNKLYSYGSHFILAVNLNGQYLINGDTYSNTTSRHTSNCISILKPNFQIPFSALRSAGVNIDTIELVEHAEDLWREEEYKDPKTGETKTRNVHYLGGVLFNSNGQQYLSGLDSQESFNRRAYFLSRLFTNKNTSVEEAIINLQPEAVKNAIMRGQEVKRQGDIFFVPEAILEPKHIRRFTRLVGKMQPVLNNNNHIATEVREIINPNPKQYKTRDLINVAFRLGDRLCRGTVRHINGDHKMLKLGKLWHKVYKNTAVESFSASGSVD